MGVSAVWRKTDHRQTGVRHQSSAHTRQGRATCCHGDAREGGTERDAAPTTQGASAAHSRVGGQWHAARATRHACSRGGAERPRRISPRCSPHTAPPVNVGRQNLRAGCGKTTHGHHPAGPQGHTRGDASRAQQLHPDRCPPKIHTISATNIRPNSYAYGQTFLGPCPYTQHPPGHRSMLFLFGTGSRFIHAMKPSAHAIFTR